MGNVFGKSKKKQNSRITDNDRAVLELKKARDQLHIYQKKIHADLDRERKVAKQLVDGGMNERAKTVLRRKRYKESLLDKTYNQLENLETMVGEIEMAEIQVKVVDGLKCGKDALSKLQEMMNIDDIESLMEDTRDAVEMQQQIENALAGSLSQEDEQAALDELEAMIAEDEQREAKANGAKATELNLPEVPTTELISGDTAGENQQEKQRNANTNRVAMAA